MVQVILDALPPEIGSNKVLKARVGMALVQRAAQDLEVCSKAVRVMVSCG